MGISGARVLITHTIIQHVMGSTVVALDVASELSRRGAEVTVYAAFAADPGRRDFEERGIALEVGLGERLALADFDYVWVQSQVLPLGFIAELGRAQDRVPVFIFNHMSAVNEAADEYPYIRGLEESLSSLSLYVSDECRGVVEAMFDAPPPGMVFPNPAPIGYAELDVQRGPHLSNLLIVSNHRPAEVEETAALLSARGVRVLRLGEGGDRVELVTPELLSQFDAVLTIGKTVQYCLVSATPVYVYDHFGGPGYLDSANLDDAGTRNFSGRGFGTRAAADLCTELIDGYSAAVEYQAAHRSEFIEKYSIDRSLDAVFAGVRPREYSPLASGEVLVFSAAQRFGARFYLHWGVGDQLRADLGSLSAELDRVGSLLRASQAELAAERKGFADLRSEWSLRTESLEIELDRTRSLLQQGEVALEAQRMESDALRSSWSYRIGNMLVRPVALAEALAARLTRGLR